jgi:hypothetical protein
MRKVFVTAAVTMVAAALIPAGAKAAGKKQVVEGSIAIATSGDAVEAGTCNFGAQRRPRLFTQMLFPNGVLGYDFDLDPKTVGKKFKLTTTTAGADLDLSFYADMGDPTDPAGAPANFPFETRKEGGEAGKVPPGFTKVIVCMNAGSNAAFKYVAG